MLPNQILAEKYLAAFFSNESTLSSKFEQNIEQDETFLRSSPPPFKHTFKSIISEANNNEINYWQEKKQLTLDKDNENELEGSTKRFVEYTYTVRICYPWKKDNVTVERSRD